MLDQCLLYHAISILPPNQHGSSHAAAPIVAGHAAQWGPESAHPPSRSMVKVRASDCENGAKLEASWRYRYILIIRIWYGTARYDMI